MPVITMTTIDLATLDTIRGGFLPPAAAAAGAAALGKLFGGQINTTVQNGSDNTSVTNTGKGNVSIK
jgi:hypothetical protein